MRCGAGNELEGFESGFNIQNKSMTSNAAKASIVRKKPYDAPFTMLFAASELSIYALFPFAIGSPRVFIFAMGLPNPNLLDSGHK